MMPSGALRISSKSFWLVGENLAPLYWGELHSGSNRITIFHRGLIGKTETRMSTSLPSMVVSISPSTVALGDDPHGLNPCRNSWVSIGFQLHVFHQGPVNPETNTNNFQRAQYGYHWSCLYRADWCQSKSALRRSVFDFKSSSTISSSTLKPSISVAACWASCWCGR